MTLAYTSQPCTSNPKGCPLVGPMTLSLRSQTVGSPLPKSPAKRPGNAEMAISTTITARDRMNRGRRTSRRQTSPRVRRRPPTSIGSDSRTTRDSVTVAHPGVEEALQQVDQHVDDQEDDDEHGGDADHG